MLSIIKHLLFLVARPVLSGLGAFVFFCLAVILVRKLPRLAFWRLPREVLAVLLSVASVAVVLSVKTPLDMAKIKSVGGPVVGTREMCSVLSPVQIDSINLDAWYVNLELVRPMSQANDVESVVLASSPKYEKGEWRALGVYTFSAGETNLPVSLSRSLLSLTETSFFSFVWVGDEDGDGLENWYEVLNEGSNPYDPCSIITAIAAERTCVIPYCHAYRDDVACRFGGHLPDDLLPDGYTVYEHVLYTGRWDGAMPSPLVIGEGNSLLEVSVSCPLLDEYATLVVGEHRIPLRPGFSETLRIAVEAGRWLRFSVEMGPEWGRSCLRPSVTPVWSDAFVLRQDWAESGLGECIPHLAFFRLPETICLHELRTGTFHQTFNLSEGDVPVPSASWTMFDDCHDVSFSSSDATGTDLQVSFPFWEHRWCRVDFSQVGYFLGPTSAIVDMHYCPKPSHELWTYYLWPYNLDYYWLKPLSPWTPEEISCYCCDRSFTTHCSCAALCQAFDPDGDGLVGDFDPEPFVASPDAHNANEEWYAVVCSNVFARVGADAEDATQLVELPDGGRVQFKNGVDALAYYFVDIVAWGGLAHVTFAADRNSRLGSPEVVAMPGETVHVPLLVGVEYVVSSTEPISISTPDVEFVLIDRLDERRYTIRWPINFLFTEDCSGSGRSYRVEVEPHGLSGVFSWEGSTSGMSLQGDSPNVGRVGSCGCVSWNGDLLMFGCSSTCTCAGSCLGIGVYTIENAVFAVTGGVCRCGFVDPLPPVEPEYEETNGPVLEMAFSASTVAFEEVGGAIPNTLSVGRSTRVRFSVFAFGGPNGGTVTFTRTNFEKLRVVDGNGFTLTSPLLLAAGESFFATCVCEGVEASGAVDDIVMAGRFVEGQTGRVSEASARLTSCAVSFVTPSGNPAVRGEERDSGDGQNEFTYNDMTQDLTVGLVVRITPDVTGLVEPVTCLFDMPLIDGAVLSWTDNGGNCGRPQPLSAGVGSVVQATARYAGYPLSNSGFGRKTVVFRILGLSISSDFEVFFPSSGIHHPACSTCTGCPNWFYYWREGGVCGITEDVIFSPELSSDENTLLYAEFDSRTQRILLGTAAPQARSQNYATAYRYETVIIPEVVETVVIAGVEETIQVSPEKTQIYRVVDHEFEMGATGVGIRAVALSIKHEKRHKEIFLDQQLTGIAGPTPDIDDLLEQVFATGIQNDNPFGTDAEAIDNDVADRDGEGLLDQSEVSGRWGFKTETNRRDTFNIAQSIHEGYALYGDDEVQARHAEKEDLESCYFPRLDWCNPGCQSRLRRGPLIDEASNSR